MKISIITVSYNSEKTIIDTFNSIREQTLRDIEYVVIDGASSDLTPSLIEENSELITKTIIEKDNGIYDAMNKGINCATGEIIGILNSDDVYYSKDTLQIVHDKFEKDQLDIVYGNINYVSYDLNHIIRKWKSSPFIKGSFKKGWHPPHPAFFVRKDVYEKCGLYDIDLRIAADFDFMLRSMETFDFKIGFLDMVITKMRIGGESNRSIKNILKGNKEVRLAFKKYNISINPLTYLMRRIFPKVVQLIHHCRVKNLQFLVPNV